MPVARFASFEEAAAALLLRRPAATPMARMRALFAMSARLAPPRRPVPGVRKFKTFAEAAADRNRPE